MQEPKVPWIRRGKAEGSTSITNSLDMHVAMQQTSGEMALMDSSLSIRTQTKTLALQRLQRSP